MNMSEYKAVKALVAAGMSQEEAVKKVLNDRKKPNDFQTMIRKRD